MRILVVTNLYPPHHVGGYEIACASFVDHLRGAGHTVRVVTSHHRRPAAGADESVDRGVYRELYWYKSATLEAARPGLRARYRIERSNSRELKCHLDDFAPDVISWWGMGGLSLSLIEQARRARIPAVGMVSDEWMLYGAGYDAWTRAFETRPRLGRWVARLTGIPTALSLDDAGEWVFVSEYLREAVLSQGVHLSRTAIGPTGISTTFKARPPRAWGGRLLYAGRITHNKGVDVAVSALGQLPPDAVLRVVGPADGDPGFLDTLRQSIRAARLEGRVQLEPPQPRIELSRVYEWADALVFPVRRKESLGLVPLEAMACGVPVLATGGGGSGEFLHDGENCLLVGRGDPHSLAAAVARLAADPDLRQRLRERGLETAARYSERECNRRFESFVLAAAVGPQSWESSDRGGARLRDRAGHRSRRAIARR